MFGNPSVGRELPEQRLVEPPRRSVIDILDGRLAVAQAGGAQAHLEAPCVAVGNFAIEQQRQPFGVSKFPSLGLTLQLDESVGHAVKLQRFELIERRMYQHRVLPQWK